MKENKNRTDRERLKSMDDSEIDFSDIPELDDHFFLNAKPWRPGEPFPVFKNDETSKE